MIKNLGWRAAIALFAVLTGMLFIVPSFTESLPEWWNKFLPGDKIHLGLDLQGGMHLVLEVQTEKAVESHLERVIEELKQDLRESKIRYQQLRRFNTDGIELKLISSKDIDLLQDLIANKYRDFKAELKSGSKPQPEFGLLLGVNAKSNIEKMSVDQALETIRNRIDQLGVSEPEIRPHGQNEILIQLPGVKDPKRAKDIIGKTARLEFKLVDEDNSVDEAVKGKIPPGDEILYQMSHDTQSGLQKKTPILLKKRAVITGEYITDARVMIDNRYNEPYVSLTFDTRGASLFEKITGDNIKKRLAIVLDNNVNSAPTIQDKISGGKAQITGRYSMDDARDLAIVLRAGALPAPVNIVEERTVGPSLGQDSINQGFYSMVIGSVIVFLFMIVYYGVSGVVADIALVLNILLIGAGLAFFNATLTLPGIAGMILTIGMSVDANVLIYERIREELRTGKTSRSAIETGYSKALVAIVDSNVTTLLTALVLFQFGTGPIKGFAVTLSIGIVASFFTAIFVTRIIFDYLYINRGIKKISI